MKRIVSIFLIALLLAAAIGCGHNAAANSSPDAETQFTSDTAKEPAPAGTTNTEPAATAPDEPKNTEEDPNMKNPIVTITMQDGGVMKLELYPDVAPNTVKNFISLANAGFYDGLIYHRIIAGFMIQGGGYDAQGMPKEPGYSIKGEFTSNGFENNLKHTRGVISMARTMVPDSAGAQFFIMHADAPHLDGDYAAFGMLLEGFDVLDRIAAVQTGYNDVPLVFPVIESIRVETFGVDYGEPEKIQ